MVAGKFVQKQLLIDQIRQVVTEQKSDFFTILTDTKRSILLRFSVGKLIHTHCRSRNVADAIKALNECGQLKFSRAHGQPKDTPEVMSAEEFLQAIEQSIVRAGVSSVRRGDDGVVAQQSVSGSIPASALVTPALQAEFNEIARDYIGLVAEILVADVCSKKQPLEVTIEQIASAMPAKSQADAFRKRALAAI